VAVAAGDAHGLLGVPAQEVGRVGDLGLGLLDRLAHLERHEQRELVRARGHELERAAQDLAALARGRRRPLGLHVGGRGSAACASSTWPSATSASASPVDGSSTASVPPPDASRHSPPM
jgi:hypothetical protein